MQGLFLMFCAHRVVGLVGSFWSKAGDIPSIASAIIIWFIISACLSSGILSEKSPLKSSCYVGLPTMPSGWMISPKSSSHLRAWAWEMVFHPDDLWMMPLSLTSQTKTLSLVLALVPWARTLKLSPEGMALMASQAFVVEAFCGLPFLSFRGSALPSLKRM